MSCFSFFFNVHAIQLILRDNCSSIFFFFISLSQNIFITNNKATISCVHIRNSNKTQLKKLGESTQNETNKKKYAKVSNFVIWNLKILINKPVSC